MSFAGVASPSVYPTDFAVFHKFVTEALLRDGTLSAFEGADPKKVLTSQIALVRIHYLATVLEKKYPGHVELAHVKSVISILPKAFPVPVPIASLVPAAIREGKPAVLVDSKAEPSLARLMPAHPSRFEFSGICYPSAQHALFAQLYTHRRDLQSEMATLNLSKLAYFLITHFFERRKDWETPGIKTEIMYNILFAKFDQNPEFAGDLLSTLDSYIAIKGDDEFWTCGKEGTGSNELGKLLMRVREVKEGAGEVERPALTFAEEDPPHMPASLKKSPAAILEEITALNREADAKQSMYVASTTIFRKDEYRRLSRCPYENFPFDLTLVHLGTSTPVNANMVLGKAYIGTQAPLAAAEEDFWRMTLEQKSSAIVMLNETHDHLCYEYWPSRTGEVRVAGAARITLLKDPEIVTDLSWRQSPCEETPHGFVVRLLEVEITGEKTTVTHYQYLHWRDRDQGNIGCVLEIVNRLLTTAHALDTPPVVHCAAGVGRTATFLAVLDQARALKEGKEVDMATCVARLRSPDEGRYYKAVQSNIQYEFCHVALRAQVLKMMEA